jgi:hypothetical protein
VTARLRGDLSLTPVAHEAPAVAALTHSLIDAEDEHIIELMGGKASESNADGVSSDDPGVD